MTADKVGMRLIRDSVIIAFTVGVVASVFANSISAARARGDYSFLLMLLFAALTVIAGWATILLLLEVKGLRRSLGLAGIPGCEIRAVDKLTLASVLDEARTEVCFLGITAKRSFSDDQFKNFLTKHSGKAMRLRVLLLDPDSEAFARRAEEEKESVASWKQEHAATIHKLGHYQKTYGVQIEVHFYEVYPVLRLIIVDNKKVVANFFLEGKRGTESSQIVFEDSSSDLACFLLKWFNVVWRYHSRMVAL
jgi:hypothetical protein